jgi:hypothetical protein
MLTRAQKRAGGFGDFQQELISKYGDVEINFQEPVTDADGKVSTETRTIKLSEATDPKQLLNFVQTKPMEDIEELAGTSKIGQAFGAIPDFFFSKQDDGTTGIGNFLRNIFKKNP